ncbi:MAG: NAD-dependent epimerase/dehydratase family protein [Alistipes sp.]|nr:NAD-dependent epimerase/dehydratase family protein [Alistipes sp.]
MKQIVVLGGVGLIGSHLCRTLIENGERVTCIDTRGVGASPLLHDIIYEERFRYIHHDITHPFDVECDYIINLASPAAYYAGNDLAATALRTDILGSINTLEVARQSGAKILYASSGEVYGLYHDPTPDEHSTSSLPQSFEIEGKRAAEALHKAYGGDNRIARLFNTYGSGCALSDRRVIPAMIIDTLYNRDITIYGSGEQQRTFCWVGDIVDGLIKIMNAPKGKEMMVYNLGSNHEISIRELAEKIISLTGSSSRINHIAARHNDPRRKMPNLSRARKELKWEPSTSLSEGLKRTVEYIERELTTVEFSRRTWIEVNY